MMKGMFFMKSYNGTSDVGNIFIISENTHPACLVQAEIETRIKDNTKIFLISNEGENEYIEHCKALQGEQISLLNKIRILFLILWTVIVYRLIFRIGCITLYIPFGKRFNQSPAKALYI